MLGEDETSAKSRYALICSNCRMVNGLAPPGTRNLADMGQWGCARCGVMNGSSHPKPATPKPATPAPHEIKKEPEPESDAGEDQDGDDELKTPRPQPQPRMTRSRARREGSVLTDSGDVKREESGSEQDTEEEPVEEKPKTKAKKVKRKA